MAKKSLKYFLGVLVCTSATLNLAYANEVSLTPNSNGGGVLPSGYDKITFKLYDGNWTKNITLPMTPANGSQVAISSNAGFKSYLDTGSVGIPLKEIVISRNDSYSFTYSNNKNSWVIKGNNISYLTPNDSGAVIPNNPTKVTFYNLSDGNWARKITLPSQASDGDYVVVRSNATWSAQINSSNQLYKSTTLLKTGDEYVFKFDKSFQKWLLEKAPVRSLTAKDATSHMSSPTSPRTKVKFYDGNWVRTLHLPTVAGNRDKVVLQSNATWTATIDGANINNYQSLKLNTGDEYELTYIAENEQWEVTKSPVKVYQAKELVNGRVPQLVRPNSIIEFSKGNWVRDLYLPYPSPKNTRVTVKTDAEWSFNVHGINNNNDNTVNIENGQTVSFKVDENGLWQQETLVIDILMLYSDKVASKLGESAARARMFESFSLTNEALENSGANFRLRMVGLKKVQAKSNWQKLGDPLSELRNDKLVQSWRNELKADAIYYEGTEDGCGLAWVGASSYNMVGTGSINCGTTVMRHEFGHNMSLHHGVNHGDTNGNYAVGYNVVKSVMGGNATPFYATPKRFSEAHGIPMGIEGQIDAVRAMNEFSSKVASYR
ncbi:zinc-dependent metalloprotease family protein [Spartinivicinus ruber]|uniref:zinc-dependent metalloprotease family protein n=1 Tax=Spartinivicinus ruber TaxID=2683272 RepID=UPI0013D169B2|nr:zinc-dependent metalloprotease family protein [Spartinivicinus ruber]